MYPVVVPSAVHSQVQGIVYLDVSSSDLSRLDRFEGEYFYRKTEQVMPLDMTVLAAEVYVLKEEYYTVISPRAWDPVHFSRTGIYFFMQTSMKTNEHR